MKIAKSLLLVLLGIVTITAVVIYLIPGYGLYIVKSDSMKPAFQAGDLIIAVPPNSTLGGPIETGSIIAYNTDSGLVTHRVIEQNFFSVKTKGDANNAPDPYSVAISDIQGVHLLSIPKLGYAAGFVQSRTGWFLCILLPSFLLVVWIVIEILKEAFKEVKAPVTNGRADGFGRALNKGDKYEQLN
ncbi:MAG: signal peptidase I [Dehalococcoidales bacterium]|nr:signal peptidase I [Dehalococcoidales bacterium]